MAEPHVIFALRRKYAERLGIGDAEAVAQLAPVILMFSPNEDLAAIQPVRPYTRRQRRKGPSLICAALGILRTANEPMSCRQIVYRIMADRGVTCELARNSMESSLLLTLPRYASSHGARPRLWYVEREV